MAVSREKRVSANAAVLAYYAFNLLVPLVLLVFVAVSSYGPVSRVAVLLELFTGIGAVEFETLLRRIGADPPGRTRAVALAGAIFLWSSVRLSRAVHEVFHAVYGTRQELSLYRQLLDSLLVVGGVLVGLVLLVVVGVVFAARTSGVVWSVAGPILLTAMLIVAFVPTYFVFPDPDVSVRETLPGATFAAGAWAVSSVGFRAYATVAGSVELYGVAGGVLLLLSWLYFGGLAVLVGVVLNAVLAGRVDPDAAWVPG